MANKLYEETSIQNIANALRLKNDGSSTTYKVSEMENGVLNFPFNNIPSYHYEEAGRLVQKILNFKAEHENNIVFGTISDNHVDMTNANSMTSARHGAFALEYVGLLAQCDFVANLGDNCVGTHIDTDVDYNNSIYMENCTRYSLSKNNGFSLVGNHDKSNSTQKLYDLMGKFNTFDVYSTTKIRGYGYKDFTDKKVRVIALNTCDYWNTQGGYGMSYEQKDFLMKALDLSSKSNYSTWTIIILSHIPLDYKGGDYNTGSDLKSILKAYDTGTTASISVNSSYASVQNESSKYSGTLTYNYSGKNAPRIINVHGHIHTNKYRSLKFIDDNTELSIMRIATPNSSFSGNASTDRYTSYGDYSITTNEASLIAKKENDVRDTSATFYCVDLTNQKVYAFGYGANNDREMIYKKVNVYSISYSLTGVTSSNTATTIAEGESYTSTITTNSGYTLQTLKVTMGGTDITSSAVSGNVITISKVTGNIVINVVATEPLVTETITPHIAPRSTWYGSLSGGTLTLKSSNTEAALGVSTQNANAFTDRNSKVFYLMPIGSQYSKATLNYSATDGLGVRYYLQAVKESGGTFTSVAAVGKGSTNTLTWTKGAANYLLISIEHSDGSTKWDWNSTGKTITVTFSNQ